MILNIDQTKLNQLCKKNDITYLGVFGSRARGEDTESSDVDLLVDFSKGKSLFGLARVQTDFANELNRDVDLVPRKNIKELLKPYILQDVLTLYEKR